jgi:hypothetical protein
VDEREREKAGDKERVCERESVCVCERERVCESERVCVGERACVCERERERKSESKSSRLKETPAAPPSKTTGYEPLKIELHEEVKSQFVCLECDLWADLSFSSVAPLAVWTREIESEREREKARERERERERERGSER